MAERLAASWTRPVVEPLPGGSLRQPGAARSLQRSRVALAALALAGSGVAAQAAVDVATVEPRAFGWHVGDIVQRRVELQVPAGLRLDDASLPAAGPAGRAIELRRIVRRDGGAADGAGRIDLLLDYQLFVSPPAVRTLELPPLKLVFRGTPRDESVRVDAWPVTVSPLVPPEVSPRRGLGELQPDTPPPSIDTAPALRRIAAFAVAGAAALGWLLARYLVLPWLGRQRRPFERAWRALRSQQGRQSQEARRAALRQVHAALNQSAGQVLFTGGIDRYLAVHPEYVPLRDELRDFFAQSQRTFFGSGSSADAAPSEDSTMHGAAKHRVVDAGDGADDLAGWLLGFSRRLRDVERRTA